jgi:glutamyl-tRNA synthetase
MDITHIIRGDDHLTNAFRQKQIYEALGWKVPEFAHIPLIHGPDGAKLSKRHGALGAEQYRDMGYLPEALLNYLLRLGWAHGDDEIIDIQKAIEWFDLPAVGRSPSRMDFTKLNHLNGHYIRHFEGDAVLFDLVKPFIESLLARPLSTTEQGWIQNGIKGLKERAKTLLELADGALIYTDPLPAFDENTNVLRTSETTEHVTAVKQLLTPIQSDFTVENIEARIRQFCKDQNLKLGALSQSLRLALTHRTISPSLFDVMAILGWDETKKRFDAYLNSNAN